MRAALASVLLLGNLVAAEAKLAIEGALLKPSTFSAADLARLPRATAAVKLENRETVYEGVLLYELLKHCGAPLDNELKGSALATYLIAQASDGYQVVFTLADIDPAFSGNKILLADKANGEPLDARTGPFRLIVPNEKRQARSIRMLQRLELVRIWK